MMDLPPWCSACAMLVRYTLRNFQKVMRIPTYGVPNRVENSKIKMIVSLIGSDAMLWYRIRAELGDRLAIRSCLYV